MPAQPCYPTLCLLGCSRAWKRACQPPRTASKSSKHEHPILRFPPHFALASPCTLDTKAATAHAPDCKPHRCPSQPRRYPPPILTYPPPYMHMEPPPPPPHPSPPPPPTPLTHALTHSHIPGSDLISDCPRRCCSWEEAGVACAPPGRGWAFFSLGPGSRAASRAARETGGSRSTSPNT